MLFILKSANAFELASIRLEKIMKPQIGLRFSDILDIIKIAYSDTSIVGINEKFIIITTILSILRN